MSVPEHKALERRADLEHNLVHGMVARMINKLDYSREVKRRGGWASPRECPITELHDMLTTHTTKLNLDMVDVCNLAAMIDYRLSHYPAERAQLLAHIARARLTGEDDSGELLAEREQLETDARLSMAGLDSGAVTFTEQAKQAHIDRVLAVLNLSKAIETTVQARARVKSARLKLSEVTARLRGLL